MTYGRSLLRAAMVAAPLSALGFGAQAADVISTIQNQQQFSTLAKAMKAVGIGTSLQGSGPYTIFAPTDQAFAQLPPGTMDYLMQPGNQDQLKKLLQYHVVKGNELQADQMIGKQAKVDTLEGGKLSLDGMGRMVLLVPAGLTVTRAGDQIVVRREVAATSAPAAGAAPAGGGDQQAQTDVTQQSNMPATKHQEEVLKQHPKTEQQQTMAQTEGAMPSTKHQREVLRGQQPGEQGAQQQASSDTGEQQASGRSGTES
jgi:Fasciclin domain